MPDINKKKGQSEVLSIALIVVIGIVAVSIIYSPIKAIVTSPSLSPEVCNDLRINRPITINEPCYNLLTNQIDVNVVKNTQEDIATLSFKLRFDNETRVWKCGSGCSECEVLENGNKTYHLLTDQAPRTITLMLKGCDVVQREVKTCQG
jgi:hypothetical protein